MGKKKAKKNRNLRTVVLKANMQRLMKSIADSQTAMQAQIKLMVAKLDQCKTQLISDGRMAKRVVDSVSKKGEKFHSYNAKTGKMILRKG